MGNTFSIYFMDFQLRNLQRLSQKAIGTFLTLSVISYFVYHSIQGDRGILAWITLQERLSQYQNDLKAILQTRQDLEEMVQALRPESIQRDVLDQRVRLHGYARSDELIILSPDFLE